MSFTWRDVVGLVAIALIEVVTFALFADMELPIINDWTIGSLGILIIGLVTSLLVGAEAVPHKGKVMATTIVLGSVAVLLALTNIFMDSAIVFGILSANLFVIWLVVTAEHAFTKDMYRTPTRRAPQ